MNDMVLGHRAVDHATLNPATALEHLRPYLCVLARMHLDRRLWTKLDPEDLVQATFQEALAHLDQFAGNGSLELKGWLRQMLLHNIWDAVRHFKQQKCDCSLEQSLDHSSVRLMQTLAADQSSPSQRASHNEELRRLAEALLQLTDEQQEAVILHHLHGMKLAEVAAQLERGIEAAAGLVHRGLIKLKQILNDGD
ncbi:MAG TPA: sigma-70 family RNA polymerase sigma factor [Pirellulaceae bacterium]